MKTNDIIHLGNTLGCYDNLTTEKVKPTLQFVKKNINNYPEIVLDKRKLGDFELLVNKAFSPLTGFMDKEDYENCVYKMRLKNGHLWTIPITLSINEKQRDTLSHSNYVVLKHETGLPIGVMDISNSNSIYKPDLDTEFFNIYGTNDDNHPYIKILKKAREDGYIYNIGGEIIDFELPPNYDFKEHRLTPKQTKEYFRENGWSKIVAFQTRNPMHRSHYELTKYALKVAGKYSRLFLNPVIGITQDCDINYSTRVKCYKEILKYYDHEEVLLNLLPLTMRMAGPREAILHAQIRKNYGCTHFIVGRDHAGPSYKKKNGTDFYQPYEAQELFVKYAAEIGIIPIFSKMIVYSLPKNEKNQLKGKYTVIDDVNTSTNNILKISGTQQRELLKNGDSIPEWFTFPCVSKILKNNYLPLKEKGLTLYFVGLSGSGKSTLANFVMSRLSEFTNKKITYLDGDVVRRNLSQGLGFSLSDRSINTQRIGYVCAEITRHNGIAIAANIAPLKKDREINRKMISAQGNYVEIFMDSSIENCEKRDVKGLYQLAKKGLINEFTGISSPFEIPENPEITLRDNDSIENNINKVVTYLKFKKLI